MKRIKTNTPTTPLKKYSSKAGWLDWNDDVVELTQDFFDGYSDEVNTEYKDSAETIFGISFDREALPHCCGISELGNLGIDKSFPQRAFNEFMKAYTDYHKGHTLIINTNGKGSSLNFETLLAKCPHFVDIKRFKSRSSGNTITMWVSNNE